MVQEQSSSQWNIYIRKLNGLGEKIPVTDKFTVEGLIELVAKMQQQIQTQQCNGGNIGSSSSCNSLEVPEFSLIFKGKDITQYPNSTLKSLQIPADGIVHLVFTEDKEKSPSPLQQHNMLAASSSRNLSLLTIKVMFNGFQHSFEVSPSSTVLDFKRVISVRLNLIYESLVLAHLGVEMLNQQLISQFNLGNGQPALVSLHFDLKKPEKKKLESRMVSSVTLSGDDNPHSQQDKKAIIDSKENNLPTELQKSQIVGQRSTQSQKDERQRLVSSASRKENSFKIDPEHQQMYKSDINGVATAVISKAAMMFQNALHQKIVQTESVVSGSFEQEHSSQGDPNFVKVILKSDNDSKYFELQCCKSHKIRDIKQKVVQLQRLDSQKAEVELSLEQDLFRSIDLSKSGCVTLSMMVRKMGRARTVFYYRIAARTDLAQQQINI